MERRRRQRRRRFLLRWLVLLGCVVVIVLVVLLALRGCGDGAAGTQGEGSESSTTSTSQNTGSTTTSTGAGVSTTTGVSGGAGVSADSGTASPNTTVAPGAGDPQQPGDRRIAGSFYGPINTTFEGLTMFRGNASRTYYGEGPVPADPDILWKFGPMSGTSTNLGKTTTWTGTGWTGQPCIFERDGKTWVVFGAYDYKIHFLDAATGDRLLPDFKGGDIFKGSAVVDPDGYPLIYMGCRDNKWRIIAIDRDNPTELFNLDADTLPNRVWNDDWDSSVVIRNDYAFEGGENSHFYILKLNRGYDASGKVTVDPQIVLDFPSWTQALLDKLGSKDVSVENSPCLVGDRVYFSNSGGLVQGLDVSATLRELKDGEQPATGKAAYPVVFKFWTGDDTDATIVADEEGFLYVCQHRDESRGLSARATDVGQIIKLDPRSDGQTTDPVVWSKAVTKLSGGVSGVWATPCIYKHMLYVPTHGGALLGIDRRTGEIVWEKTLTEHTWASCIVVDKTLIVGDTYGVLHAWDVSDTSVDPPVVWEYKLASGSALESTPAVWKGRIYLGSRDGYFYCFGDG
ncbi:MAG: PQQ-binding-like beta-propeller repeat protein [bacterium]